MLHLSPQDLRLPPGVSQEKNLEQPLLRTYTQDLGCDLCLGSQCVDLFHRGLQRVMLGITAMQVSEYLTTHKCPDRHKYMICPIEKT